MYLRRRINGFSLIEVMVAMLIVAIGILGVAGLQVVSLQQNRNAILRDQALQAGNDILDRIRANPVTDYAPVTLAAAPLAGKNCITSSCTPAEMSGFDIAQWKCRMNPLDEDEVLLAVCEALGIRQASLPGGKGSISKVGSVYLVTVQWIKDRNGNTNTIELRTQTR